MSKTLVVGTIAGVLLVFILGGIFLWQQSRPAPEQPAIQQIPPPSPQPQVNVLDTSTWQTYRSEMFGFEFKHPGDWTVGRGLPSLRIDAQNLSIVQIDWIDSTKTKRDMGFCEDYLMSVDPIVFTETQRCERFTTEGISIPGVIDWKVTGGWANALFDDGLNTLSVTLGHSRPDSDYKAEVTRAFFRAFLSTFRFVESQEAVLVHDI